MSATLLRDRISKLAKQNTKQALIEVKKLHEPWFRTQALAWILRFADSDVKLLCSHIEKSISFCEDTYQRCAVRAWYISALAENERLPQAQKALNTALRDSDKINLSSSRSEALLLLLQAAMRIGESDAMKVYQTLQKSCADGHWRCQRALRDSEKILSGELEPRQFFW